ncbi:MAG: hypothetical protein ACLGH6_04050 [Gammaproteobacteria bacterium]
MTPPFTLRLKSALLAGAAAGLFAPALWPLVVLATQGRITDWYVFLSGLVAVAGLALAVGLLVSLVVGFPVLLLLHKLALEHPPVVIGAGALIATITLSKFMSWSLSLWPLYLFAMVLGGLCGLVAVGHMRTNHAVKRDAPQAVRPLH